jgi:two-component system phosphate regulon sensor histidine kinase PhoR
MPGETVPKEPFVSVSTFRILDRFPDPVLLIDGSHQITAANAAAHELFGANFVGRHLALSLRHPGALDAARRALAGDDPEMTEISLPPPVGRDFALRAVPFPAAQGDGMGTLLVFHDITALKKAEQLRADFVANVSHELRSPVSSLVGFIETLKGAARDDAEARERFLGIMEDEAHRLARLIDDLLSLSRVEAEEHVRPSGDADLSNVLGSVCDLLAPRGRERGIEIEMALDIGDSRVVGDDDELREVFHNIVENALKYGAADEAVRIAASRVARIPDLGGPGIMVAVTNRGDPIPAEHLPRLTERFYRVDKGRSRQLGGTGLGLAIVKHIVNRHRGRLSIQSGEAVGTTVTVHLPTPNAPKPA